MGNRRVSSFSNSYAVKSFIPRNIVELSTHHHLRVYLTRTLLETPYCLFGDEYLSLLGKYLGGRLGIFLLRGRIGLWVFHNMLRISYRDQLL